MRLAAIVFAAVIGIGAAESRTHGEDAAAVAQRLTDELTRVEKGAPNAGDSAKAILTLAQRARKAIEASRLYLALDDMQDAWTIESGMTFRAAQKVTTDAEFTKLWQSIGKPKEPALDRPLPLVVVAIAQASASRAPATYMASKPYSEDAGIEAGLYHLGEARAQAGFAAFCASLPFDRPAGPSPAIGSIEKPLVELETEAAKAYPAGVEVAIRQIFMRANVALKVARQLEAEKKHAAALEQLLVARYRLGQTAAGAGEVDRTAVAAKIDDAAKRVRDSGKDHSIAELFIQRARMLLETPDAASLRSASIIADAVLPLYARHTGLQP
jgi:hypothetical protein